LKGKNIDEFKTIKHMYVKEITEKKIILFFGVFQNFKQKLYNA
jgi:hypothetical protein